MPGLRAEAPSWEPPGDLDLNDEQAVLYWSARLQVTPCELEEVVERVCLSEAVDSRFA